MRPTLRANPSPPSPDVASVHRGPPVQSEESMSPHPLAPSPNMLGPFSPVFRRPGEGERSLGGRGGRWKGSPKAVSVFRGVDHRDGQSRSWAEGARVTGRSSNLAAP